MDIRSFNPQPAAQADRRPADLFKRRWTISIELAAPISRYLETSCNQPKCYHIADFSLPPGDSLLCEARLNEIQELPSGRPFNPQPAAQADRRPADLFKRRWTISIELAAPINRYLETSRNQSKCDHSSAFSRPPGDSLLCEARLNEIQELPSGRPFNPQPAAQADRRPADLFKRRWTMNIELATPKNRYLETSRNQPKCDHSSGFSLPPGDSLLCEARLNEIKKTTSRTSNSLFARQNDLAPHLCP